MAVYWRKNLLSEIYYGGFFSLHIEICKSMFYVLCCMRMNKKIHKNKNVYDYACGTYSIHILAIWAQYVSMLCHESRSLFPILFYAFCIDMGFWLLHFIFISFQCNFLCVFCASRKMWKSAIIWMQFAGK